MKGNFTSMETFLHELERREAAKQDLVSPRGRMGMPEKGVLTVADLSGPLTAHAHGQLAETLGIPKRYYDSISTIPGLREHNVNALLQHDPSHQHTVRFLDGGVRAVLGDNFFPFDNVMALRGIQPVLREYPDVQVWAQALTETRMFVQFAFPGRSAEIRTGDVVWAGLNLRNSEVGSGALAVEMAIAQVICTNMAVGTNVLRKYHVGRRTAEDQGQSFFKRDTIEADVHALTLKLRDTVEYALSESQWTARVAKMRDVASIEVANPMDRIEEITERFAFSTEERDSIGNLFLAGADRTEWGMAAAVTATARNVTPDRAYEIERVGNELIFGKGE